MDDLEGVGVTIVEWYGIFYGGNSLEIGRLTYIDKWDLNSTYPLVCSNNCNLNTLTYKFCFPYLQESF